MADVDIDSLVNMINQTNMQMMVNPFLSPWEE